MKKFSFRLLLLSTLFILGVCRIVWPVSAQGATLAVEPENISLPLGSQLLVELVVTDGENVNGFDITLNYDNQFLSLAYWMHGGYLQHVSCLQMTNEPGLFQLACEQIDRPEASGDGTLIELVFDTEDEGLSEVRIVEAEFIASDGTLTSPEREQGLVDILNLPTYTPTPTVTLTPTITATLPPTDTPTRTQTFTPTSTFTPAATATYTPIPSPTSTVTPDPVTQVVTELTENTRVAGQESGVQTTGTPAPNLDQTQQPQNSESDSNRLPAYLVWGLLIIGAAIMIFIITFRRKKKTQAQADDLL